MRLHRDVDSSTCGGQVALGDLFGTDYWCVYCGAKWSEDMNMETIDTAEQARQKAIDWQSWASEQNLSMGEYLEWSIYFEELADRFGLTEEFRENGII